MGIKIPNGSGGYTDLVGMKRPNGGGGYVDCQFAKAYNAATGLWENKWIDAKPFYIIQDFNLVNPAKMGGWRRNNFYAYVTSASSNGGRLGCTAQSANNGNVKFATWGSNAVENIGPGDVTSIPFSLEKCNKCRIVIDSMGGTQNGSIDIRIGGISVHHNYQWGVTHIIDLGEATISDITVNIVAWATNTNFCYIKELYFYKDI